MNRLLMGIGLVLLLTAVVGWFFAQNRKSLGKNMQFAAIWGLIFVGAIAGTTFLLPAIEVHSI